MNDILAIQTEVAQRVVSAVHLQLGGEDARALAKKPTENPEAHRLYLLGRYHSYRSGNSEWDLALQYFQRAVQLDPTYALAYCGWADAYAKPNAPRSGREAWAKQRELAQKALSIDPLLAEAHVSLGAALCCVFDWEAGIKSIRRALELNPNLALAYSKKSWADACHGRFDAAIENGQKAIALDPLNPILNFDLAYWLNYARRYDEAKRQLAKTLELEPASISSTATLGWCALWQGDLPAAIAHLEKATKLDDQPMIAGALGYAYAMSGERAKAAHVLREFELRATERYVHPAARAFVHLGLGAKDKALDWLEQAYENRDWACWYFKVHRIYDPIRTEPRFQALLKKVGLDQ